ncbi:GTPase domain-containing protein [Mahella australiensis]|nr:GTPase domain-containing protein [Mahella australiensis]
MKTCVLIGKPNVGKTLLLLNLAKFLGNKTIKLHFINADGNSMAKVYDIEVAKHYLCNRQPFSTMGIQWARINVGRQYIELVDTTGLTNDMPEAIDLRSAMAQTIIFIKNASILLHVVDASALSSQTLPIDDIDTVLSDTFGRNDNYLMLVNKIDMMDRTDGLSNKVTQAFNVSDDKIIYVSALNKTGFNGIINRINE